MSFKPTRPFLTRRSVIAATAGLAASTSLGKRGLAQITESDLPAAGPALNKTMPAAAPQLNFTDARGRKLTLADYAGHGLVVNLWATWCGPCVAELPSLAAIAPLLARRKILVLPISIDMLGVKAVRPFFASRRIAGLPILLDSDGAAMDTLNAQGIPVTIVIDPAGRLVARLDGAANWNTPETIATIRQLAGQRPRNAGGVVPADEL